MMRYLIIFLEISVSESEAAELGNEFRMIDY